MRLFITVMAMVTLAVGAIVPLEAAGRDVTVGLLVDGTSERSQMLGDMLREEVQALLAAEFDLEFPENKLIVGDWTRAGIAAGLDRLLQDPEVDAVIAIGAIAAQVASQRGGLEKPVIAPLAIDPTLQGFPFDPATGGSGVDNFSYVGIDAPTARDIREFLRLHRFTRLAVIVQPAITSESVMLSEALLSRIAALGVEVIEVPAAGTPEATVAAIPVEAEAVYVLPLMRFSWEDMEHLAAGLMQRRLPSFSMFGRTEVERGLLGAVRRPVFWQRLARRVALNLQRVLHGENAGAIPIEFDESPRLVVNLRTARAIGVYPTWQVMTDAELLHEEADEDAPVLELTTAVSTALDNNLELVAISHEVAAGTHQLQQVRARLLPQAMASATGIVIDSDRAAVSFGSQAERSLSAALALEQVVLVEPALAGVSIQKSLLESRQAEQEQLRLDVALEATIAYLNVLRARALLVIERDNLRVTRSNLDLALTRQRIGTAGASEVYRWESAIASNRRAETLARERVSIAKVELNRVLNRPLDTSFRAEDVSLASSVFITSDPRFFRFVYNPRSYAVFMDFMVEVGLGRSPELQRLDAAIAAADRNLSSARRRLFTPQIALRAEISNTFGEGGAGSEPPTLGPGMELPQADDTDWSVALRGSLPLFAGGANVAAREQAREELFQLQTERRVVAERIEQRIRTALHLASASYYSIELARAAAEAADKSLELVTEAYAAGAVSITELLDAQNAALRAGQAASSSVYDFLGDLMEVQRATNTFDFFQSHEERDATFAAIERFFAEAGVPQLRDGSQ